MTNSYNLENCQVCPGCNTELAAISGPDQEPTDGDLIVCLHCQTPFLIIINEAKNFSMKKISVEDYEAMDDDKKLAITKAYYHIEYLKWLQIKAN